MEKLCYMPAPPSATYKEVVPSSLPTNNSNFQLFYSIFKMSFPQPDHSSSYGGGSNQYNSGYPNPGQAPQSTYPGGPPQQDYNQQSSYPGQGQQSYGQQSYGQGQQSPYPQPGQGGAYGQGSPAPYGQAPPQQGGEGSSYYGGQQGQQQSQYGQQDQRQDGQQQEVQYDENGNPLPPGERGVGTMALGGAAGFIGNKMTGGHMGGFSSIAGGAMAAQG